MGYSVPGRPPQDEVEIVLVPRRAEADLPKNFAL